MYDIIENHPDFVVIYKKPNASFHSEAGEPGLFETLRQRENFTELFPVHRLDKVTSGLLVMAKNANTNQALVQAFARREVEKFYVAISAKKPLKKQGLVIGDMAQARRGGWKLLPEYKNPAITQFFSKGLGKGKRLFILKPHTGKTHQIRVAMKSLGAPIVGDNLYSGENDADRVYLHAYSLAFNLNGIFYRFTVLPNEGVLFTDPVFKSAFAEWQEPWDLAWPSLSGRSLCDQ
ncbi:MAG TPA: TIGR01621 family pseudouridine synthase [Cellvibrio sp.]|nr:TIGR01621 family pseudouridine synthase [Cellvibrio sp.]